MHAKTTTEMSDEMSGCLEIVNQLEKLMDCEDSKLYQSAPIMGAIADTQPRLRTRTDTALAQVRAARATVAPAAATDMAHQLVAAGATSAAGAAMSPRR